MVDPARVNRLLGAMVAELEVLTTLAGRDLIGRGALKAGRTLVLRRRSNPAIEGTLTRAGSIGWRVPRLDHATLAEIRDTNG